MTNTPSHFNERQKATVLADAPMHVLITGATSGLGWALAEYYAAQDVMLSLTGRNDERLEAVANSCRQKGAVVETRALDVTDADAIAGWLVERDDQRPIDILFANAGLGGAEVMPPPSGEDGKLARRIVTVNTLGVINSVTPLLPRMVTRRRGQLVLIGSISGAIGLPQSPVYCASKAAVKIYGDALRRLVRRHGVRVTNVLPGFIDTPMSRSIKMARPWCWSAEKAAERIARDVAGGKRECIFPWQLRISIGLQNFLPTAVSDFVLSASKR